MRLLCTIRKLILIQDIRNSWQFVVWSSLVNQKRFQDISTQDFLTPSFSTPDFSTLLVPGLKVWVEYSGVEMSCNLQKNAKMIGDPHEDFDLAQLVAALPEQYGNMSFQVSKGGYKIS